MAIPVKTKTPCPLSISKRKRNAANKLAASIKKGLPSGLAQPALRTLAAAGYSSLDQIAKHRESGLLKLHGIGPKAIAILKAELKARSESLLP